MWRLILRIAGRFARVLSLVLLAALGTIALTRVAPGYFSDEREMDAQYSSIARADIDQRQASERTLLASLKLEVRSWCRRDLGQSKQYDVPVAQLIRERTGRSGRLVASGVCAGWLISLAMALVLSARRTSRGEPLIAGVTSVLLALPVGVLATVILLMNFGDASFVLAILIAARDFKLLYRIVRSAVRAPQVLFARAQGFSYMRILRVHLFASLGAELLALGMMSFVVALSALVPVEVIFDVPGLGQLAWSAAMNRDVPVLVAVTLLMASCVGLASMFVDAKPGVEAAQCA